MKRISEYSKGLIHEDGHAVFANSQGWKIKYIKVDADGSGCVDILRPNLRISDVWFYNWHESGFNLTNSGSGYQINRAYRYLESFKCPTSRMRAWGNVFCQYLTAGLAAENASCSDSLYLLF